LLLSTPQFQRAVAGARAQLPILTENDLVKYAAKKLKAIAQQSGSGAGTEGSTNVTSKGLASKVLSIASEYGALTESVSGQTTTASGTLAGVPLLLMGKGVLVDCATKLFAITPCLGHKATQTLSQISYSVSFDTNPNSTTATGTATGAASGAAQPVTISASSHSISALSVKWAFGAKVDKTKLDTAFSNLQSDAATTSNSDNAVALENLQISNNGKYQQWLAAAKITLANDVTNDPSGVSAEQDWEKLGAGLAAALGVAANITDQEALQNRTIQTVLKFAVSYNAYLGTAEAAGENTVSAPFFTIEYDVNRPASQPSNSVIRGIYEKNFTQLDLTVNGAVSIYNSNQSSVPGAGYLRDVQFATELGHDFKVNLPLSGEVAATLSGAFYFQYQSSPSILNVTPGTPVDGVTFTGLPSTATQVYAQKGNIELGQIKLSIGSGSSVTVPLSVTYSNRTELITNPTWKAQIGVSYDFDSLFSNSSAK
jgi:hypothetical protein